MLLSALLPKVYPVFFHRFAMHLSDDFQQSFPGQFQSPLSPTFIVTEDKQVFCLLTLRIACCLRRLRVSVGAHDIATWWEIAVAAAPS